MNAHSSIIRNSQKKEKKKKEKERKKENNHHLRTDKWNVVYLHNGINLAMERNEALIHATWMNLEDSILSERSQKTTYCIIPFI